MPTADRGPVPVPPPLLYLAALLAGIALDRLWPLALLPRGWDYAFFLGNGWVLIFAAPVLLVMNFWVVRREECHLEAKFGEDYRRYKAAVRRWL